MHVSHILNHGASAFATYSPHISGLLRARDGESDSSSQPGFLPESYNNSQLTDFGMLDKLEATPGVFTHGLLGVNQDLNFLLTAILGFTLAGLVLLTLLTRWIKMANAHLRFLFTHADKGGQRYWARNHTSWWPSIKTHIMYAPLWRVRHNREIKISSAVSMGTLPSRFHTILLVVYIACNVAYCLMLDWKHELSASVVADLRGRSGQLATLNIIPTVLFALRNNPLIPILRVPYDTFNLLHRWCARVVVVQTLVHTIAFAANTVDAGGMQAFGNSLATSSSYAWGMVATVLFVVIALITVSPIRHAFYETFVNMHRLLVLVGLIGVYLHIERAKLPQLPYVRAVFALWIAEWVTRLYHIVYNNISARSGLTKVVVEALPAEACRVTFQLARPWRSVPGAHAHIYLPSISGWASHPFSIAWSETTMRLPALDVDLEKLPSYHHNRSVDSGLDLPPYKTAGAETHVVTTEVEAAGKSRKDITTHVSFIIRARTGMTRALYDKAVASPTGLLSLKGGIEGPYGGHESLQSYGTVILFAGGVGITHCLSHLKDLLMSYEEGTCSTRRLLLVWSVPNTEALEWVRPWMDQILRMEGRKDILRIQLFITKPRHQNEIRSNTGTVQMFPGRCNPNTIIDKEMNDRIGAMGVAVCGPGSFADGVRAAVRTKVNKGSVDFVEEAFTY